jgi:hypothetical protein
MKQVGTKTQSNRKRKSLSHVPSPLTLEEVRGDSMAPEIMDVESRKVKIQSPICFDDEEDLEQSRISPKRRRKRQSMMLPQPEEINTFLPTNSSRTQQTSRHHHSTPPRPQKSFSANFQSMKELRKLVRGYCSRSNTEQATSEEAKAIRELTGYPLPSKAPTSNTIQNVVKTSKEILADRRLVFQKIAPTMSEMEKRKDVDIKQWESDTGCRVEKSSRSGKYRYYDLESNQRMPSQEYKQRYMAVIEEGRAGRAATAQFWMDMIQADDPSNNKVESETYRSHPQETLSDEEMNLKEAFLPPKSNLLRGSSTGSTEDEDMVKICGFNVTLSNHINGSSIMKLSDEPSTMATTQSGNEPAEIVEVSSEDTEEISSRTSTTPSPIPVVFNGAGFAPNTDTSTKTEGAVLVAQSRDEGMDEDSDEKRSSPGEVPLLPIPSRDVQSMDPEVAEAERRLWEKIDNALKEYSEEVMAIMKSKQTGARVDVCNGITNQFSARKI